MINFWLICTCWLWINTTSFWNDSSHGIYLSHTEIEVTEGGVNIQVKVFSNDLQNVLKNHDLSAYKPADLNKYFSLNEKLAERYFNDYLQLWNEDSPLTLKLEGFSIEGDAHFIQLSTSLPKNSNSLTVKANLLTEIFPTQINVVKVKSGAQVQFLRFNIPIVPQTINF